MSNVTDSLEFESVWCKITTTNSEYHCGIVYHPPDPFYDPVDLPEYMLDTCDQILADDPNAKVIIAGDIEYRSDDVIKMKFVKLWDLLRYSERTTSKTPTRQK